MKARLQFLPGPADGKDTTSGKPPNPANSNAKLKRLTGPQQRNDQAFLPAALEILETPPSPVRIALIYIMAAFIAAALLWMYFGRIDIIAIAQGKIQPPGRVKVIQPVEAGKVLRIPVRNGNPVTEGDMLVELDPSEAQADVNALETLTLGYQAEIIRRGEALVRAGARLVLTLTKPCSVSLLFPASLRLTGFHLIETCARSQSPIRDQPEKRSQTPLVWPDAIPGAIRQREEGVLFADLAQLDATLASINAQIMLKRQEDLRLRDTIAAQAALVETQQERVNMRSALNNTGSGSKASLIDGKEAMQKEAMTLASQRGQLRETGASIHALEADRDKQLQGFLAENMQKQADASRQLEEFMQRLVKARNRLDNKALRSPAQGIVQASSVYTIGQVVSAGQEIMRIVPSGATLEVEAYIPNKDIGFIAPGQEVSVKVESFPFTRYGMLTGRIMHVAQDAIPLPDAAQIEGNPARPADTSAFAGAQRTQNLVFPVLIALEQPFLMVEGRRIAMSPGMTVTAEIKTGSRRILEYLFSPLVETTSEAMRER